MHHERGVAPGLPWRRSLGVQAFSMYQCVTYEEMPESDSWYKDLTADKKEQLGFRTYSYLIADVQEMCVQDAAGEGIEPEDERIRLLGRIVLGLFCGAVPLLYMVLLMLARRLGLGLG